MVSIISRVVDKYRKEASDLFHGSYRANPTWRQAILESIFRPKAVVPGKTPTSHLHPDIDKLHLPPGILISDWRKYRVEDHPALVNFQKRCHASGLHDPWLRNYAFSYYPSRLISRSRMRSITTGIRFGFVAGTTLYILEKIYDSFYETQYQEKKYYIDKHDHH